MLRRITTVGLAASLFLLTSCRTSTRGYFEDRLHDTLDWIPCSVAAGPGFYVGARATSFLGTGVGYAETNRAGLHRRSAWPEDPFELVNARTWSEKEKGLVILWTRDGDPKPGAGNLLIPPVVDEKNDFGFRAFIDPGSLLDAEVEAHIIYLGIRIGASPIQIIDWLLGWATLDFLGDDLNARFEGKPAKPEAEKREAEKRGGEGSSGPKK